MFSPGKQEAGNENPLTANTVQQPFTVAELNTDFIHHFLNSSELKILGEGSYGKVHKVKWREQDAALKISRTATDSQKKTAAHECSALTIVSEIDPPSPYLIKLLAYKLENETCYLLMEYIKDGSLAQHIDNDEIKFSAQTIYTILSHTALAIQFLHRQNIGHFDVKSDNILLNKIEDPNNNQHYAAKLIDLGFAREINPRMVFPGGTPGYAPSEIVRVINRENIHAPTLKCDIYSFGITMLEAYNWEHPFYFESINTILANTLTGKRPAIKDSVPPKIQTMIQLCWRNNIHYRPTITQLVRAFNTDLNVASDELNELENDLNKMRLIIHSIRGVLFNIVTIHQATLAEFRNQAATLENMYHTQPLQHTKQYLTTLLNEMIEFFSMKCIGYNQLQFRFFGSHLSPIEILNSNRSQHRLARGIGHTIKKLIDNTTYSSWLKTKCGIDLEARLNEKLVSSGITLNIQQLQG